MDNGCPEDTQYQYATYPSGDTLVSYFSVRRSNCNRKLPQGFYPRYRAERVEYSQFYKLIIYDTIWGS